MSLPLLHRPPCRFAAKPFHPQVLAAFMRQVLAKGDVYFVTYSQLRAWMELPVPKAQMGSWLKCSPVDFAAEGEAALRHTASCVCKGGLDPVGAGASCC